MPVGPILATVQMPPDPFLRVVIEAPLPSALRARPLDPWRVLSPDIDLSPLDIQVHSTDGPWSLKP